MSTKAPTDVDHSYDYHTFLSRCSCKYLPEVVAGTGVFTNLGGAITAIAFNAYMFIPFGFVGAAGFAGCFWYSRKVRLRSEQDQGQGAILQTVMEKASQAQSPPGKEKNEAESKFTEELMRRKIDSCSLQETVIKLYDDKESLTEESTQIHQELQQLLSELEDYRTENEGLYKKIQGCGEALGIDDDGTKAPTLYTVPQVHTNISYLHQVKNNVGVLHSKGLELFTLLATFVEKLAKEKEILSKVNKPKPDAEEMLHVIAQLELEVANLKQQLSSALSRIATLEEERKTLLLKVQKT
jgi:hypothetical protein